MRTGSKPGNRPVERAEAINTKYALDLDPSETQAYMVDGACSAVEYHEEGDQEVAEKVAEDSVPKS